METKLCPMCLVEKPLTEFYKGQYHCKSCDNERNAAHKRKKYKERPDQAQSHQRSEAYIRGRERYNFKKKYGITPEEYAERLEQQNGVCAICSQTCKSGRRLAVDHDHVTGTVRGLLCGTCNIGLGCFQDDPILLGGAIAYLKQES